METIAVYWEENIKTYGIRVEKELCLLRMAVPGNHMAALGRLLSDLGSQAIDFRLALVQETDHGRLDLYLVCEKKWRNDLAGFFSRMDLTDKGAQFELDCPVEMLYFHGPHFGDRYGIADMAFNAIEKASIRFLAAGCSAASLHFIFTAGVAAEAKIALNRVFKNP